MRSGDLLLALAVTLVFGVNFVFVKFAVAEIPPLAAMVLRFCIVAALLIPFARVDRARLPEIALLSVTLGCFHFALLFIGLRYVDAGTAAIAIQLQVPFGVLLGLLFFGEGIGPRRVAGMAIAFAGIFVIFGAPQIAAHPWPLVSIVAAALIWSVTAVQIKKLGAVAPSTLNFWVALFALPQLAVASLLLETGQIEAILSASLQAWAGVLYMIFGATLWAYTRWYKLLARNPVGSVMPFILLIPVWAVLSGWAILGEEIGRRTLAGGALVILGVGIIVFRRKLGGGATPSDGTAS